MTLTQMDQLFMKELRSTKKYQEEMAQAQAEADARYEAEMEELERLYPEDITVEDVEIEMAQINEYRGQVLDGSIDIIEWLNNNAEVRNVLNIKSDNLVEVISRSLDISDIDVIKLLTKGLGVKIGTEYQTENYEYLRNLRRYLDGTLKKELYDYLHIRKLYEFYRLLIDYVEAHLATESLSNNEDDIVFYIKKDKLKDMMVERKIPGHGRINHKMNDLCELGLITSLRDEEIRDDVLHKANKKANAITNKIDSNIRIKRDNYYVLVKLSPSVQREALRRAEEFKRYGAKRKGMNSTRRAEVLGVEEVQNNISVQKTVIVSATKQSKFVESANELIEKQKYFTQEDLRKAYCKKDRNVSKKDAEKLTEDYLPGTLKAIGASKVRVNESVRKEYELPAKIKSNSFIYCQT